ncbi:MAG: MoaD/ThiS family protein [Chloroflexi bacterium]|nr:MoaD/ThiS family protein [Chloroflexota bacterium]MCL5026774.1 MoaD/ThiS family protein [Chloroflexota bacterium]
MRVEVALFGPARDAAGQDRLTLELDEGADIRALLALLIAQHGDAFRRSLLQEDGTLWPTMAILANGRNVSLDRGLATTVHDGDEVAIMPVISGGRSTAG